MIKSNGMFAKLVIPYLLLFSSLSFADIYTDCSNTDSYNFSSSQLEVLVDRVSKCSDDSKLIKKQVGRPKHVSFASILVKGLVLVV